MEKIAIIGLSCLFPGAQNSEQYWQNIREGKKFTFLANKQQMGVNPDLFYSKEKGIIDKYYCKEGGYINYFKFDSTDYQLPGDILESLDPLYQWSLYVAKQALQDSGYLGNQSVLSKCGVILGNLSFPTRYSHHLFAPIYHQPINSAIQTLLANQSFKLPTAGKRLEPLNGNIGGYPATIIAQALSLSGISFSLDAACASSLYSIKLSCDYLLTEKADLMLAGAVSCADPLFINMGFSIFQAYPEDGISCPLNHSSGGLIAGEGAGIIVLKRYEDALRDGDRIYATINGIGLSNDGKGKFVLSPNSKGQILAFERAYQNANLNPNQIDYIECHATGTPLGDITELNSMEAFFSPYQTSPLLGSVKSNLGHLMTVAGIASLIKVVLSLNKNLIPPTINIDKPLKSDQGNIGDHKIVTSLLPWKKTNKLAAVSAFGFGGCNAHLIVEKADKKEAGFKKESLGEVTSKLAIIGMDAFFGGCDGLAAFERTIYQGKQHFIPLPPLRWQGIETENVLLKNYGLIDGKAPQGAYITDFEFDFLRFKIPPKKEDQLIPQQLLLMKVADQAIRDSGLKEGGNVAVIVAMETELALHQFRGRVDLSWQIKEALNQAHIDLSSQEINQLETLVKDSLHSPATVNRYTSFIGNVMASRVSALWDFTGPAFTVSSEENSVFKALEIAQVMLSRGEVEAVVLGAIDLAGGIESVLLHQQRASLNTGVKTLSFDQNSNGWLIGEGGGAIVLKNYETAQEHQDRIYAKIDGIALMTNPSSHDDSQSVFKVCQKAFKMAGIEPNQVQYLEAFVSGNSSEDDAEIQGLIQAYQTHNPLNCCLGSIKTNIGHTYAASGIASLIKTTLCLYHGYLPATHNWSGAKRFDLWKNNYFYVPTESKSWLLETDRTQRIAAINGLGMDNTYVHLILSSEMMPKERPLDIPSATLPHQPKSILKKITLGGNNIYSTILTTDNLEIFSQVRKTMKAQQQLKIIQLQINQSQKLINSQKNPKPHDIVWDEADLLEFAQGNIANIFGQKYKIIDSYSRRVRLPLPPYLLVSRVTKINAEIGQFKPCSLTTEYDIPNNAWYTVDGQAPWAVSVESGQCDLLLISYLGIDFENKGNLVYRLLDCTLTFLDELPKEGDTLRYDIKINSFVRNGENLLFFFSYECFVKDKMILKMDGGCAGFFSDEQLAQGKGIIVSDKELEKRKKIQKQKFEPLLVCNKLSFNQTDLLYLTQGNIAACFGSHYHQYGLNPSLRLPPSKILMIDTIVSIDLTGGAYGLGLIIAAKNLEPEHWYFPCHFKDDQVLAGSLMAEGCGQLLQFYLLYLGLQTCTEDARFQPIYGLPQVVRCRGQVTPISAQLIYQMEITEIGLTPHPYAKCNVDIILQGKTVVHFQDLGLQLIEKKPSNLQGSLTQYYLQNFPTINPKKTALLTEEQVQEFCLGSVAECFGQEYKIYDQDTIKVSRMPNTHLSLVSRVLEVQGERYQLTKGSTIITEYDVPANPWYYRQNSSETIPYSILMEIALQPCGFLSAYLGTTLLYPNQSLYFRNLDGEGHLIKNIDFRRKTITNTAKLLSSSNIQGMILQSFDFQLSCENEVFYQGFASFGHFSPDALANQVGLDQGKNILPWYEAENSLNLADVDINLKTQEARLQYYKINPNKPFYRLAQYQLDLLNEVKIIPNGGKYQKGYIYARKEVQLTDWYFKCHFYQDPVMPGSLGVEAIIQAMQVYALQLDLGKHLKSPKFTQLVNHKTIWKYRGQIPPNQPEMYLEIHLSKIEINSNHVIIIGDASLWKPKMRIYEVKNLGICLSD